MPLKYSIISLRINYKLMHRANSQSCVPRMETDEEQYFMVNDKSRRSVPYPWNIIHHVVDWIQVPRQMGHYVSRMLHSARTAGLGRTVLLAFPGRER